MTQLRKEEYRIPAAELGPENPLPMFRRASDNAKYTISPDVPGEETSRIGIGTMFRVLPHRLQDTYSREKRLRSLDSLVLENENLQAVFLPQFGGRLVSLFYKPEKRELLERNPVFQPANLALRNAWFSGGIEWNTCLIGHYFLTCSPIFASRIDGKTLGPILRLYEWDRVKCFPWQIDFCLPPGSHFLFARIQLTNPHDHELPMYWWTNMAVSQTPDSRVFCAADSAIGNMHPGFGLVKMPTEDGTDLSYPARIHRSREFFYRIPQQNRHWISALDKTGSGFVETSTPRLRGRKMFCWGTARGGRRWQEFLSEPGRAYIEIQAGLAQTQPETVPMPAKAQWDWTEAFGPIAIDPAIAHGDWKSGCSAVAAALDQRLPGALVEEMHLELGRAAGMAAGESLALGSGWGELERRRQLRAGTAGASLTNAYCYGQWTAEQQQWLDLLDNGAMTERDPQMDPGPSLVQPEWKDLLVRSVEQATGDHWLTWLHLGNSCMENRDYEGARAAWTRSLEKKESSWALRNLAVLDQRRKNIDDACRRMHRAWQIGPRSTALAIEYGEMLRNADKFDELQEFLRDAPADVLAHERIAILEAAAALQADDYSTVEKLFAREFATIREGETILTDFWYEYHSRRIAREEGLSGDDLANRVRRDFPPPFNINFRMAGD